MCGVARKLHIEYPGAFYHVINRGNYRSWIFETEGARHAFLLTPFDLVSIPSRCAPLHETA